MTKKELIKALEEFDDNAEMRFSTRKNPPRTMYCIGGVQKTSLGAVFYAG